MKPFLLSSVILIMLSLTACKPLNWSNQIAVVDLNAVAKALGRDDAIIKDVKSANNKLNTQLEKIAADLQKQLDAEKSKLGNKPSKEEEQKFVELVQKANNQLNQTKQVAIQKSQQVQNSLVAEFRNEVSEASRRVAQENGYLAVMTINDNLLWSDATVDITNEVITEIRYGVYKQASDSKNTTTSN